MARNTQNKPFVLEWTIHCMPGKSYHTTIRNARRAANRRIRQSSEAAWGDHVTIYDYDTIGLSTWLLSRVTESIYIDNSAMPVHRYSTWYISDRGESAIRQERENRQAH